MSGSSDSLKTARVVRHVLTLFVALGLFAATAVVVWPKLQGEAAGVVRIDLVNATDASMLEFVMEVRLPVEAVAGPVPGTIAAGETVTLYEGPGPARIDSMTFVTGTDGSATERQVRQSVEPGGLMVLTVTTYGVGAEFSSLDPEES